MHARQKRGETCSSVRPRQARVPGWGTAWHSFLAGCRVPQPKATPKIRPMMAVTAIARLPPTVTRNAARPSGAPPR